MGYGGGGVSIASYTLVLMMCFASSQATLKFMGRHLSQHDEMYNVQDIQPPTQPLSNPHPTPIRHNLRNRLTGYVEEIIGQLSKCGTLFKHAQDQSPCYDV
jgi:hypothetical protein